MSGWNLRRGLGALSLVGMALIVVGLFLPWIVRINYLAHAHCPNGPGCPPPSTDAYSLWQLLIGNFALSAPTSWLALGETLGAVLLVLLFQAGIGLAALRGRGTRLLFAFGLVCALAVGVFHLLAARIFYCLFYCGGGLFTAPGVRMLGTGFWLLVAGFAVAAVGDLALLVLGGGPRPAAPRR
jgi:hypothetical protein